MKDTFERSCEHWSEAKRSEMDAFYALATTDYRILAEAMDWRGWLESRQQIAGDRSLKLLDVACGSGKFPVALAAYAGIKAARIKPVAYSLLDPSPFSIAEAKAALPELFQADSEYEIPLQKLDCPVGAFDIAWATHALYAVSPAELPVAMRRFLHAIGNTGVGVIAHASEQGHYIRFHREFLSSFGEDLQQLYSSAEQVRAALEAEGAAVETRHLAYTNGAPDSDRAAVEGFLQRCAFDDRFSLEEMLARQPLAAYLQGCLQQGHWRFPQRVDLMIVTP